MKTRCATRSIWGLGLSLVLITMLAATPALARNLRASGGERAEPHPEHDVAIAALEAVGTASGWGRVEVRDDDLPAGLHRTVRVHLLGLEPWTEYLVEIDGVEVGSVLTRASGSGVLKLQNRGRGHDPVPEDLPEADSLEGVVILDPSLAVVLEGSFSHITHGDGDVLCEEEITLEDVTAAGISGVAKEEQKEGDHQELSTCASGLEPEATYSVVVDGLEIAVVTADAEGQACVELEHPDESNPIPPELLPVCEIATVEWFDNADTLLLTGTFTGDNEEACDDFEGTVVEVTADGFTLDTGEEVISVVITADTEWDGFGELELAAGDAVEVEGCWDGDVLVAEEVERLGGEEEEDEGCRAYPGTVAELTADGFILDFVLESVTVVTTAETEWQRFDDHELAAGDRVVVEGCWDGDVFVAERVLLTGAN